MKLFLSLLADGAILIMARAEDEGIVGDLRHEIRPGQEFLDRPYEWFRKRAPGTVEISD